jgi:PEP-CTERM motif
MPGKFWISKNALLVAIIFFVAAARPASASIITYTETISDQNFLTIFDLFDGSRELTRTRTSDGTTQVETDDATIVTENGLSGNWGLSTFVGFSWNHLFSLDPPAGTFLHGSLTLDVIGVDGELGDVVFVEFFPVGALTSGGTDVQSTTFLSTDGVGDPNMLLSLVLADGQIHVEVLPLLLDVMTIRSSTAEVTYEAAGNETAAVPEPATAVLLLSGLAAGGWRRLRHARRRV